MYEYISGKISELAPTYAVVENQGIGYMIRVTLNSYAAMEGHEDAKLYIEEIIREDAHTLVGFCEKTERELFKLLVSVSGIGANTALVILSSFSVAELQMVISSGDVNSIKKVKGIGLKTAQRLIVDLKDKMSKVDTSGMPVAGGLMRQTDLEREEAVNALVVLGYTPADAANMVDKVKSAQPDLPLNKVVKEALRLNK